MSLEYVPHPTRKRSWFCRHVIDPFDLNFQKLFPRIPKRRRLLFIQVKNKKTFFKMI